MTDKEKCDIMSETICENGFLRLTTEKRGTEFWLWGKIMPLWGIKDNGLFLINSWGNKQIAMDAYMGISREKGVIL